MHHKLKENSIQRGYIFSSDLDTGVITHLYAKYVVQVFHKLNGLFIITLFDGKENIKDVGINLESILFVEIFLYR